MDRVEKMLGRMKASKLYRCVDWDPEGKAKDLVDKFNSASRSETMTRTGEYLGKLFAHMGKECYIEPPFSGNAIFGNRKSACSNKLQALYLFQ